VFPDWEAELSNGGSRMRSQSGEIRILNFAGQVLEVISFAKSRRL